MTRDLPLKALGTRIGHATLARQKTGCTVLLFDAPAVCGVQVTGGAPGTRETDLLDPTCHVNEIHAILLTGGSAFGLAAADGVMRFLAERKIGYAVGTDRVPIVPAAVIYDRATGEPAAPTAKDGYAACQKAAYATRSGAIGAGCGARVGKFAKNCTPDAGGIGVIVKKVGDITIAAVMVVNAFGNVIDPASGHIMAGATDKKGNKVPYAGGKTFGLAGSNTIIGAVITDAALTKAYAKRIAMAAHDGLARTVVPAHTMFDGDTIFAASTGEKKADINALIADAAQVTALAILAAVRR